MKTGLKIILLFTTIALLTDLQSSNAQVSNPSGELKPVDPDLIWAQTLSGSHFNEFWNYQFYFENGMKLHIVFSAANFGSLKSPVTGVRVSALYPDGEVYQLSREYPIERLVQDKENHMFRLHPERDVWFEGELPNKHRVRINTSKDGVTYDIDLRMDNIADGLMWGDGKFSIGREKIGIITHIPYAEVRGTVSVDGNRERVRGTAYMDHTFQDQTTTSLMHSGYRYIHHQDRENWDIVYFMLPNKSSSRRTIGYRITKEDGETRLTGISRIKSKSDGRAFGNTIPRVIELEGDNGKTFRISRLEDEERFSLLGELGRIARRAARTFLGGEVIDYRGEATLIEQSQRPKPGEYNFFFVD
ncbi:MAG: hypothetical protein LAT80_15220 [Balneolaceae bacterium]|nr:hypothetical protein [Balneolaceae bacterium]